MFVLGRTGGDGPVAHLGQYRARDGSTGARVGLDLDGPHAAVVVGKRGTGKSYTLGVLAEELARTDGIAPVVIDPMGAFRGLAADGPPADRREWDRLEGATTPVPATVREPTVPATALPPRAWPELLGLDPAGGPGSLVWRAAAACETLAAMCAFVADADVPAATRRAAANHLRTAREWGVFDADAPALTGDAATVLDCRALAPTPAGAVVRAVAARLYRARIDGTTDRLPWLLVDEAHAFTDGVAGPALRRVLTRGRAPGVSLALATQRPAALPEVAVSQADLVVAHRLTGRPDRQALERVRPSYATEGLVERLPERTGTALIVDDASEVVHEVAVRERDTPHTGDSPRVSS